MRRCRHDPSRALPAPDPLEDYAAQFDDLFARLAQRRAFHEYLHGLLLPRERNKTLTGLAGAEPVLGAQAPPAQRLQWFLSEAAWDAEALAARRLDAHFDTVRGRSGYNRGRVAGYMMEVRDGCVAGRRFADRGA